MNRSPCPRTDDVLAAHLDGDVDGGAGWSCLETVADHLRDCGECQRELQRARRLDAALAEAAGRSLGAHVGADGTLDPLLARLTATDRLLGTPATASAAPTRRRVAARTGLGLLVGALLVIAAVRIAEVRPAGDEPAADLAPFASALPTPTTTVAAPTADRPAEVAAAVPTPAAVPPLQVADSALRARPIASTRPQPDDGTELARFLDPATSPHARLAAVQRLFGGDRAPARLDHGEMLALLRELAPGGAGPAGRIVMAAAHDGVRGNTPFVQWLRTMLQRFESQRGPASLDDAAALLVGSRLGVPELDAVVLRTLRRHPEQAGTVAAALRSDLRRRGAGALLLEAWSDLAERGQQADDAATAGLWFADQPPGVYADVAEALAAARSSPRRVRCLLALQWSSDPAHALHLDQRARGSNHQEALAAGRDRHAATD